MNALELLAALDKTHAWATEASDESRNEDGDGTREYDNDMRRFHEARAAVVALLAERDALAAELAEWKSKLLASQESLRADVEQVMRKNIELRETLEILKANAVKGPPLPGRLACGAQWVIGLATDNAADSFDEVLKAATEKVKAETRFRARSAEARNG